MCFVADEVRQWATRAARVSEKRSHLDLQLNLLSEQENTKMMEMLEQIGKAVGADFCDGADVKVFAEATQPGAVTGFWPKTCAQGSSAVPAISSCPAVPWPSLSARRPSSRPQPSAQGQRCWSSTTSRKCVVLRAGCSRRQDTKCWRHRT